MRSTIVALAIATGASTALADTVSMKFVTTGTGRSVSWHSERYAAMHPSSGGNPDGGSFAGQLLHNIQSADPGAPVGLGDIYTFCTEINQNTSTSYKNFTVGELTDAPVPAPQMSAGAAAAISRLYFYAVDDLALDLQETLTGTIDGQTANNFAAAFQLAIWEIVEDYDESATNKGLSATAGVGTDDFWVRTAGLVTYVNDLLAIARDTTRGSQSLKTLTNPGQQDQIILVPLPTSAGLAAVGLFGVVLAGRRRFA
jgi:hypothetical protein